MPHPIREASLVSSQTRGQSPFVATAASYSLIASLAVYYRAKEWWSAKRLGKSKVCDVRVLNQLVIASGGSDVHWWLGSYGLV